MNEYGSLESTNLRSSDNQSLRQSLTARTRAVLQTLDGMPEVQVYFPTTTMGGGGGGGHTWVGGNTLSQTTETSSISGSVEMDLDMERLKVYGQALRSNVYHLVSTLIPVDGLKGLDMVKNPDKVKDCEQADGSTHHILDLEGGKCGGAVQSEGGESRDEGVCLRERAEGEMKVCEGEEGVCEGEGEMNVCVRERGQR